MNDIVVTLNKKIDRSTIHVDTSIEFINNYGPELGASALLKYSDLSTDEKEALNVVLDKLTYEIEGGAYVFTIDRSGKTFDLSSSYVRDAQSTEAPLTAMTTGQSLVVRFEIPGFTTNAFREISLFYNDDFLTTDLDELAEIGISITGNGQSFTIANDVECKVTFFKPEVVTETYIINDVEFSNIIAV